MQSWVETGPSVKLHRGNVRLPFPDKPPARCSETPAIVHCSQVSALKSQSNKHRGFIFFFLPGRERCSPKAHLFLNQKIHQFCGFLYLSFMTIGLSALMRCACFSPQIIKDSSSPVVLDYTTQDQPPSIPSSSLEPTCHHHQSLHVTSTSSVLYLHQIKMKRGAKQQSYILERNYFISKPICDNLPNGMPISFQQVNLTYRSSDQS